MINKTVIINRAVPGSGKTTITNCIVKELLKNSLSVSVHSTDEYFMVGKKYLFELKKLGEYHNKNFDNFKRSILAQTDVVICDNTNIAPWQTEPYTNLAREYNYNILFITFNPRELEQHIESQMVTPQKPDAHGVHEDILKMMINEYFIYDDLLNKNIIINKQKHMHYKWNNELNKKIIIDTEKHFDSDYVIRILPDEYKTIQSSIGNSIFELINRDIKTKTCLTDLKKHSIIESPLESAIIHNDIDTIRCFLNERVTLTNKCSNGLSLLEFLFFKDNYKIIKEFYKFFSNEIKEYILNNPLNNLLLVTYLEDLNLIDKLLKDGLDINQKGKKGDTPLHVAVDSNNIKLVEYFIQKKADLNAENDYNNIPLVNGLKNHNKEIVQYLISQHKKINLLNDSALYKIYQTIDTETQAELLETLLKEMNIDVNEEVHYNFFKKNYFQNSTQLNRLIINIFVELGININTMIDDYNTILQYARNRSSSYSWFLQRISEKSNNRAFKLLIILSNFTIDKPIKYTTHTWDFGELKKEYGGFDGYISAVKKQFDSMKSELEELSPNLNKKIYTFLLEENPDNNYSWCSKTDINIGWSSLDGLQQWCDDGKNPFDFKLPSPIFMGRQQLATFGEVINLFKQEIEIRADFKNLEQIFLSQNIQLDLSAAKLNTRQFYTDTQKFSSVLSKILSEMKKRDEFPDIKVSTTELKDRSIEIQITQIGSYSNKTAQSMLKEVDDGDFADIKENLTNLCDWSIESSYEDESFRVNFLHSNNVKEIERLESKPKGFTHILRFYK